MHIDIDNIGISPLNKLVYFSNYEFSNPVYFITRILGGEEKHFHPEYELGVRKQT